MDGSGNVYLAGSTDSSDFPTTSGAYDTSLGGSSDFFFAKLNPGASGSSSLVYSTYLGGKGGRVSDPFFPEFGFDVDEQGAVLLALDSSGNVYVTRSTPSSDFPVTSDAYDPSLGGTWDVFVTKLDPSKSKTESLVYSTYLGGSGSTSVDLLFHFFEPDEQPSAMVVDGPGNIYLAGTTQTSDFPTTAGAFAKTLSGSSANASFVSPDTFVVKFSESAPAPSKLAFSIQPSSAVAGASISPGVKVLVQDASGNTVTTATNSVTIAIGTNAGGGTLSGTKTVAAVSGIATFSDLSIDKAASGYTLTATATELTSATSSTFNITPGTAAKMVFTTSPSNSTAGADFSATVAVQDSLGNTVTSNSSASVRVAIKSGTGTSGATLRGTLTKPVSAGTATFSGLSIDKAGTSYQVQATATSLTSGDSSSFNITTGTATKLGFTTSPSNTTVGTSFTAVVAVQDTLGNTVTSDSTTQVTVAIKSGTGTSGATLSGTKTVTASSGVASFSGLSIDKASTGYQLTATSGSLASGDSSSFDISAASATLTWRGSTSSRSALKLRSEGRSRASGRRPVFR